MMQREQFFFFSFFFMSVPADGRLLLPLLLCTTGATIDPAKQLLRNAVTNMFRPSVCSFHITTVTSTIARRPCNKNKNSISILPRIRQLRKQIKNGRDTT